MLLSLNTRHYPYLSPPPSPYPKTLLKPSHLPLFPIPNSLFLKTYRSKFLLRSSIPDSNAQTHEQPKTLPPTAIQRIADKLHSLGFSEENKREDPLPENEKETNAAGEIFIPLPHLLPKYRVGHTLDPSWSTPENPVPRPGSGNAIMRYYELSEEIKREKEEEARRQTKGRVPTLAELTLSSAELRRLRRIGFQEKRKVKVGKAGITEGIVNGIHERWRRAEVVKIVSEDLCRMNMKRTHDLLERKTGGLVVWRCGTKIILYRGANYKYPYFLVDNSSTEETASDVVGNSDVDYGRSDCVESVELSAANNMVRPTLIQGVGLPNKARFQLPGEAQLAEEADRLLDGLGPRFTEWWGYDPLPVDADLLPAVVPGYRQPFRLLPYGIKRQLTDDELTTLKRLGRPLPCHFALGRNRKHQGLAAAIIKLWEKCEIAKIAVKRGVQCTSSRQMAEELKRLTGGTLLSRDREFFVLYRGKDFLPSAVSSVIKRKRSQCLYGDNQRMGNSFLGEVAEAVEGSVDGTNDQSSDLAEQWKLRSTEAAIKRTSKKLSLALEKKAKAEKLIEEIGNEEKCQQPEFDKETITEEERYMLRKVGLKMKPFLLTGRRGVYDGTIENIHLHWKYRELVKVIRKERSLESVYHVARTLEAESGGILVAVERVSKGYAIIVYRGKNYKRPDFLRPRTLLNRRAAMLRSLEEQRRESLKLHVLKLSKNIDDLRLQLAKDKEADNMQPFVESKFQVVSYLLCIDTTQT
uniref:CRM-domain containing factor CFM2ic n=1 Tax=Rhizophora mucronata TaxID=61149 RepID=A0A2P2LPL9_RHIMU